MQPLFEHRLTLAALERLGQADRRAVALDMPGFGTCDRLMATGRRMIGGLRDPFASTASAAPCCSCGGART